MNHEPVFIVGSTASGKSSFAIALAERIGGEIVNADTYQLYEGLDICTAKPPAADLKRVPHHLFSVISPAGIFNADQFAGMAQAVIKDIQQRGRIPVIVGGSGLYVKTLTHGLSPLPFSQTLRDKLSYLTLIERAEWLVHRDHAAESSINLKNERHVTRALEICLLTGQPQSELRLAWRNSPPAYRGFRLLWNREVLDQRINERVIQMFRMGLVSEIATAGARSLTADKAIGVREIRAHLARELSLEEAIATIQLATRQYSRRQEKWFRRETGFTPLPVSGDDTPGSLVSKALVAMPGLVPR